MSVGLSCSGAGAGAGAGAAAGCDVTPLALLATSVVHLVHTARWPLHLVPVGEQYMSQ